MEKTSKRAIDKELLARIDERQKNMDSKLELIYHEVKKTNGRVTVLENWKSSLIGSWKTLTIIGALLCTVCGFIGWLINSLI